VNAIQRQEVTNYGQFPPTGSKYNHCKACDAHFFAATRPAPCPNCGMVKVNFIGNYVLVVDSKSVDLLKRTCECGQKECKHIVAADQWIRDNGIFNRAKAVVENSMTWYAGQTRALYKNGKTRVNVEESRGELFLAYRIGTTLKFRERCGYLGANGWKFTYTEKEYAKVIQ